MSKSLRELFDEQSKLSNKSHYTGVGSMTGFNKGKKFSDEHRAKIGAHHKGKVVSEETRAKMSASRKGLKRGKPVTTPLGSFANTTEAATAHKCSISMMQWFLREKPELYFYTEVK